MSEDAADRKPGKTAKKKVKPSPTEDKILIHGVSDDGSKFAVLRARGDHVEAGVVSHVKEGEPLQGELIKLTPRPEFPLLCDVETEARINAPKLSHGGPAQVATASYRANWDAIFSKKKPSTSQLN